MFVQIGFEGKGFATSTTNVWFGVGVGLDVRAEIGFVGEGFTANCAFEGFFT